MYILAFDIGTSAIKASLVSFAGQIVDSASFEYGIVAKNANWVEQDSELWWTGACKVSRLLMERNAGLRRKIAVIGVCGHMLGCLPVDAEGKALRLAMVHADTRALTETEHIAALIGRETLYHRSGSILSAQTPLGKVLWLKRNEPEVYAKTARFLQSKDYLVSRLTGVIDVTDYSDASHAMFIDIHTKEYLTDVLRELSLDPAKFPQLYKGTDVVGNVTDAAARELDIASGIPVIAGGGDGACANVGAGITTAGGEVYGCIGTTAWITYSAAKPFIDKESRVFDIMSLDGETFGVFGTMQAAGKSIEWAKDLFGIESSKRFDEEARLAPAGSGGLVFLPYLDGERSPIFDAKARGVFFNLKSSHGRPHFTRGVLEGVTFALRSILEVYRETRPIKELRLIGGGAVSKLWLQIIADVCGAEVHTTDGRADSVTSLGVALAAGVAAGAYKTLDEAAARVGTAEKLAPNKEAVPVYEKLFNTYMRLYPQLKMLYEEG
jgi:xylulokinase